MKKISEGRTKVGVGNHLTWKKKTKENLTRHDRVHVALVRESLKASAEIQKEIEQLTKKNRVEIIALLKKFKTLTRPKQRDYGTAALLFIAVLEAAIANEQRKR